MLDQTVSIGNTFENVTYQQWKDSVEKIINSDADEKLIYKSVEEIEIKPLELESVKTIELLTYPDEVNIVSHGIASSSIDLTKIHNAGASIIQELTFAINEFSKKIKSETFIQIDLSCDSLYFANIAKLRALRFICERLVEESAKSIEFKITAHNSLREQTLFDPWVNMLRSTASSMAAIIGGANSVSSFSYDQLFATASGKKTTELGRRQADNILKILLEESHLSRVKDPTKGSYSIDNLTWQIVNKVWESFQKDFDATQFAKNVEAVANKRYELVQKRKWTITGVNNFANPQETLLSIYKENFSFEQNSTESFPLRTIAYEFEKLRTQVDIEKNKMHLVMLGSEATLSARANFSKNYFELLGLTVNQASASGDIEDQVSQFKSCGADHAIICATDEDYKDNAQIVIDELKIAGAKTIYLAGKVDDLRLTRLTDSIYMGQNVFNVLSSFVKEVQS